MAFFDKFRTNTEELRQTKDCAALIVALDSEDPGDRANAARALSTIGIPAIPDILSGLKNANRVSRARMVGALASVGAPSIPLLLALILRSKPDLQASIAKTIAETDDSIVEALLPALHHEKPTIRRATVIALQKMGKKAIPPLTEVLRDDDHSVRREAANVLATLRWVPDALPEKVQFYYLLEDWAELAKLQGAAVPVLLKALSSKDSRVRCESARTLGKIRDSRAVPALVGALKDPQSDVRIRAVEALGEMGDDRARVPLVEALNDPDHQARMEAAWALDRLGWVPQNDQQRAEYLIAKDQWNELVRMGRPAIPPLIQVLEVDYSGVRTGASEALRQLGQPAINALNAEVASDDPARQQRAQSILDYILRRQEETPRSQPAKADSSRYEKELEEGLTTQKRFEEQFKRPDPAPSRRIQQPPPPPSPPPRKEEAPESPEKPVEQTKPLEPTKPADKEPEKGVSLEELLEVSREAEAAWEQVKAQWKTDRSAPATIPLDQLIPLEAEQEAADTGEQEGIVRQPKAGRSLEELGIPDLPEEAMEELPEPLEPAPTKTPLEQYLEALKSGDENVRAAAVAALQSMGKEAVLYLVRALGDPHHGVRIAAAEGLGEIGDNDAVEALTGTLRDAREDVRIAAASALGRIGDHSSIQVLIRLFGDRYHGVRVAAADAVAGFGHDALGPLEKALNDPVPVIRVTAAKAMGLIGAANSIPVLIGHLGDTAPEVRWSVARALAGFGPPAIEPLTLVLRKGSKEMRLAAIDVLWEVSDKQAGEALLYALEDEDEDVREKAAAVLRKRRAIDVWQVAFGGQVSEEERTPEKKAAQQEDRKAFERSGRQKVEALIAALKDKDWRTQLDAATHLIMMGRPAVDGLIQALRHEDPNIQAAAAGLLGEMREAAVTPLMNALNDTDRFVRIVAARNLGRIGNKRAIEALIGALHREPDGEVRAAVVEGLSYMGSRQAIEPLSLALRDRDERVQIAAAMSLGYIGDQSAIEPLILALRDVDDRVRHAALEAMRNPGSTMRSHLVGALRSGNETFRAGVAEALEAGGWKPETGEQRVLYLMALNRWSEVERAGTDALPVLAEALDDPLIEVRANAVKAINRIGGEGAVAPLVQALDDDALVVRKRAERGLIQMGGAVIPKLDLELGEGRPKARERLQRVIDEIRAKEPEKA